VHWRKSRLWLVRRQRLIETLHQLDQRMVEQLIAEAQAAFPDERADAAFSCCMLAYTGFFSARRIDICLGLPTDVESLLISPYVKIAPSFVPRFLDWVLRDGHLQHAPGLSALWHVRRNAEDLERCLQCSAESSRTFGENYRRLAHHVARTGPHRLPEVFGTLVERFVATRPTWAGSRRV
jgi:hypothetical protein